MDSALLIVNTDLVAQPQVISSLKQELEPYEVHQQLLERLQEGAVNVPRNKFSLVRVAAGDKPIDLSNTVCNALYEAMKPGSSVSGDLSKMSTTPLLISGFVNKDGAWKKPEISDSAPAAVPLKRNVNKKPNLPKYQRSTAMVSDEESSGPITPTRDVDVDTANAEEDLIDEDGLVQGMVKPAIMLPAKCDPGQGRKRRRACKDCTCGLKELEQDEMDRQHNNQNAVLINNDEIAEIDFTVPGKAVGGCGNCALGDAFRCDGCPYIGLPPFKPGEVVSIDQYGDDF